MPLDLSSVGYPVGLIGLLLSIASVGQVVGSSVSGSISDKLGRVRPLVFALACAALALAGLTSVEFFPVAVAAFVLLGLAGGAVASTGAAVLGDSPFGRSGFGIGLYWVVSDVASIFGPLVSGLLAESLGFDAAYIASIALVTVALLFVARARRDDGFLTQP